MRPPPPPKKPAEPTYLELGFFDWWAVFALSIAAVILIVAVVSVLV